LTTKTSIIIGAIVMTLLTSTVAEVFGGNENEDEIESPELIQTKQEHSFSLTGDNCVSVDCVKVKIRYLCETGQQPRWIDCIVIQHCLDLEKQQSMYCAGGLLSSNRDLVKVKSSSNTSKTESCNSYDFGNKTHIRDFLDRSWCYSYSQQLVVLNGCTTVECIKKCELEPLPAPPECARMVLL
jgi:hypothetical protein